MVERLLQIRVPHSLVARKQKKYRKESSKVYLPRTYLQGTGSSNWALPLPFTTSQ